MTKEEMKQVLIEDFGFNADTAEMYVEQFYYHPIEEWGFRKEGNFVKGFHIISDITPDFFRELLEKRKKAAGKLPGLKAMAYISKGIHEAKMRMKENKK